MSVIVVLTDVFPQVFAIFFITSLSIVDFIEKNFRLFSIKHVKLGALIMLGLITVIELITNWILTCFFKFLNDNFLETALDTRIITIPYKVSTILGELLGHLENFIDLFVSIDYSRVNNRSGRSLLNLFLFRGFWSDTGFQVNIERVIRMMLLMVFLFSSGLLLSSQDDAIVKHLEQVVKHEQNLLLLLFLDELLTLSLVISPREDIASNEGH
jgi:hypothetical protein